MLAIGRVSHVACDSDATRQVAYCDSRYCTTEESSGLGKPADPAAGCGPSPVRDLGAWWRDGGSVLPASGMATPECCGETLRR